MIVRIAASQPCTWFNCTNCLLAFFMSAHTYTLYYNQVPMYIFCTNVCVAGIIKSEEVTEQSLLPLNKIFSFLSCRYNINRSSPNKYVAYTDKTWYYCSRQVQQSFDSNTKLHKCKIRFQCQTNWSVSAGCFFLALWQSVWAVWGFHGTLGGQ